ncbi:MAG: YdcF family protein [Verrucomicrobiia bacterium]
MLLLGGYLFRVSLLTGLADAWVVNDPVTKADAIVILGGGLENRPFAAAKLFHDGVAPQILYMNVRFSPAEEMGIILPEREQTRRILLSNNVPETAMTMIGTNVASTYDESMAVRAWIEKSGAKTIIIPTDPFHTRRARWVFGRELENTKTEIHVVAINPVRYQVKDWWRHEEGVIAFQNEAIKYLYYRFEY